MEREDHLPGAVEFGINLSKVGVHYENENKKKIALAYYQRVLTIYRMFLPSEHSSRRRMEESIRRLSEDK